MLLADRCESSDGWHLLGYIELKLYILVHNTCVLSAIAFRQHLVTRHSGQFYFVVELTRVLFHR
jgi:hypothetical protein